MELKSNASTHHTTQKEEEEDILYLGSCGWGAMSFQTPTTTLATCNTHTLPTWHRNTQWNESKSRWCQHWWPAPCMMSCCVVLHVCLYVVCWFVCMCILALIFIRVCALIVLIFVRMYSSTEFPHRSASQPFSGV